MARGGNASVARLRVGVVAGEAADVVVVSGEVDVAANIPLARELQRLANDRDGGAVVDLRKVRFMDTTGVHHLLTLQRRLKRQRRRLTVVCAPGLVYWTLHTLGLRESLNVVCRAAAAERDGGPKGKRAQRHSGNRRDWT